VICWFVYIGKNPRFTAFLDSNLHTRLAIVTENELGLAFPPRNLPQKISSRSVHVLFSYRGNKQTDRQTNAGDYIIPRESFRGDNKSQVQLTTRQWWQNGHTLILFNQPSFLELLDVGPCLPNRICGDNWTGCLHSALPVTQPAVSNHWKRKNWENKCMRPQTEWS